MLGQLLIVAAIVLVVALLVVDGRHQGRVERELREAHYLEVSQIARALNTSSSAGSVLSPGRWNAPGLVRPHSCPGATTSEVGDPFGERGGPRV